MNSGPKFVATTTGRLTASLRAVASSPSSASSTRSFGSGGGTRGARGHGWWINYRAGKGGRHLQGEYAHLDLDKLSAWNDAIFSLGSQFAYMDVLMEPLHRKEGSGAGNDDSKSNQQPQRLTIELASEVFPRAIDNFTKLLEAPSDGYKMSSLHRIEKNVGFVGGNVWRGTGKCAEEHRMLTSVTAMEQKEKMVLSHLPGTFTMLSQRVKEIDSRFMMCTKHAPHLDGMAVAIGRLDEESIKVVQNWEETLITQKGRPTSVVLRIVDCGLLDDGVAAEEQTA